MTRKAIKGRPSRRAMPREIERAGSHAGAGAGSEPAAMQFVPDDPTVGQGTGIFDQYGQNAYVRVRRVDDTTKQWVLEFRLTPEEATEETIQDLRGGGKYKCERIEADPKTGSLTITGTRTLTLGGPAKPPGRVPLSMTRQDQATAAPAAAAKSAGGESTVSVQEVLDVVKLRALAAEPPKGTSMTDVMTALAPIVASLTALVTAMMNRPKGPDVDLAALVDKITQSTAKAQSPATAMKEVMDAMSGVLDLKERRADLDRDGDGDGPGGLLRTVGPYLERLLDVVQAEQRIRGGTVTAEDVRKRLASGSSSRPAAPAVAIPEGAPPWQQFVLRSKAFLLRAAGSGKDAEIQALYAYDMMPDAIRGSVRELMAGHVAEDGPNAADQIVGIAPEFAQYRAWLLEFCDVLAACFFPAEPGADDAASAQGEDGL